MFELLKRCFTMFIQSNFLFAFKDQKKGLHLSPDLEINLLKVTILSVILCTSLMLVGEVISSNVLI